MPSASHRGLELKLLDCLPAGEMANGPHPLQVQEPELWLTTDVHVLVSRLVGLVSLRSVQEAG